MPATVPEVATHIARTGGDDVERLAAFAQRLFAKADESFLEQFDPETLAAMARDSLAFLDGLGDAATRVEAFNPDRDVHGWESPFTVLRLALTDRPFIVDSVRGELRRQGIELVHLLHPIFTVRRGQGGRIEAIAEPAAPLDGDAERLSVELFFVEHEDDQGRLQHLAAAVERVLHDVILATDDYRAMRERVEATIAYLQLLRSHGGQGPFRERSEEIAEYGAFLEWLLDDNFVFLGYREYGIAETSGEPAFQVTHGSGLGILRDSSQSAYRDPVPVRELPPELRARVVDGKVVIVNKTNNESTVHRRSRMDYIGIKQFGDGWQLQGERRFLGLLTSKAHMAAADEIPILRRTLRQVLELDGSPEGSHDYKAIVETFNSLPRSDLFWAEPHTLLREIRAIIRFEREHEVRLTLRPDPLARGIAAMVLLPRDRFDAEVRRRVQQHLTTALEATHVDYRLAMGEDEAQVRMHFFLTTDKVVRDLDVKALEREVAELTRSWADHVRERLLRAFGEQRGRRLAERYLPGFDDRYRADMKARRALRDIEQLEALQDASVRVDLSRPIDERRGAGSTLLRVYHPGTRFVLSDVLPVLENLGFRVLEQAAYVVTAEGAERGIEVFRVQDKHGAAIDVDAHGERLVEAATLLLGGEGEHDRLNRLVLYGGLTLREVALLRTLQMYYGQLNAVVSRRFINETLLAHPRAAQLLVEVFGLKFDPDLDLDVDEDTRSQRLAAAREAFADELNRVDSLPEDQTLRGLLDLIDASVRTNYYLGRSTIALKIDSQQVAMMPDPRPRFEIGVAGPDVEGTHLRGGLVARGGLRWSDRPDDFRTEVLGLMKTQMTKNAVIVPVGSKGGFVVKRQPSDRDALREHVRTQYSAFVRCLLDLTDNVVDGQPVHPERVRCYDGVDPYLVVAADKGTATFSDLANSIAAEYDFWLGDAFASGGSQGYDHKAEGITARGAWTTVLRHFRELGRDPMQEPFTVVGIGDMSGDVFGNGLLQSPHARLIAAFNHLHVFIDPDPDPARAYAERRRLFELPRSSWNDYDRTLISAGGGVFERAAKRVPLTDAIRSVLGIEAETVSGQELVRAVLQAEVDLLWNGGIGTYVKASSERHADVGDSTNDAVRVDASELRARIVGEGGNLGLTQLARIEFARNGGRINTDAIDNAGGVAMSDREVNIKMLLQPVVRSGELADAERSALLKAMTDDVSRLVLFDVSRQALALALAERRSRADLGIFGSLLEYMSGRGLDIRVEQLPGSRAIAERAKEGEGLTRPELAVLMAYVKMGLYRRLLETDVPSEPALQHYLVRYFPRVLDERFGAAVRDHPLRREIAATQMTNLVVDLLGMTFVHRMIRDTGASPVEIIRAGLMAFEVIDAEALLERLDALPVSVPIDAVHRALTAQVEAIGGLVRWMLLNDLSGGDVGAFVDAYRKPLAALRRDLAELLPTPERRRFQKLARGYQSGGFAAELAHEAATFDYVPSVLGVIEVSRSTGVPLDQVAQRFFAVGERLGLGWLRDELAALPPDGRWATIAVGGLVMDLRGVQQAITERYLRASIAEPKLSLEAFLQRSPNVLRRFDDAYGQLREAGQLDLASGSVLARLLEQVREG
jgi:glutamate dehydrogenase